MTYTSEKPYAEIEQAGRWTWTVRLGHGLSQYDHGWLCLGRRHAERKARRVLRRHIARESRRARSQRIEAE